MKLLIYEPRHEKTGSREADQRLCFRYTDASYIRNFKPLAILCGCTARSVSDLVGNP